MRAALGRRNNEEDQVFDLSPSGADDRCSGSDVFPRGGAMRLIFHVVRHCWNDPLILAALCILINLGTATILWRVAGDNRRCVQEMVECFGPGVLEPKGIWVRARLKWAARYEVASAYLMIFSVLLFVWVVNQGSRHAQGRPWMKEWAEHTRNGLLGRQ